MNTIKENSYKQPADLTELLNLIDTIITLENNSKLVDLIESINQYRSVTPRQAFWIIKLAKKHSLQLNPNPLIGNVNVEGFFCENSICSMNETELKKLVPILTKTQGEHVAKIYLRKN